MKSIIKKLLKESLIVEFYGKKIIEPLTKRFNDSSNDMLNKLGIAFLFKGYFGDIMQYKTKEQFDAMFDSWYANTVNGLIKTTSFSENKPLARKYLDAYINNIVSLGDAARPFSFKTVETNLVDLVNNKRWVKDEDIVAGPNIYEPEKEDVAFENDEVIILDTDTKAKCVRYGAGESWCITKPDLNYYNTYRLTYGATPYFVLQKNVSGDEHKLVILNYGKGEYSIADRSNTGYRSGSRADSMSWTQLEREIPNLNGLEKYFPYREITDDERKYAELLDEIKVNFSGGDLQELIDSYANKLVVNGSQVTSEDFIRDLAANQMYFNTKQLVSLRKESLDSLIESGYFVNKYYDSYLYENVLTNAQINRILKLKLDNHIVLDEHFMKYLPKDKLKEYLLKRLYANNYRDSYSTSDAREAKLNAAEIIKVKELLPNQPIYTHRFDVTDSHGLFKILLVEPDKINDPEVRQNLDRLDSHDLIYLLRYQPELTKFFVNSRAFKGLRPWDYEALILNNPKNYKLILSSIDSADDRQTVVRYLRDSGLYPYFVRDGFIRIDNQDDFNDFKYELVNRDKSKAFVYKPELLQYIEKDYDLETVLVNQPTLFKYLGDKIELFDDYFISDIIVKNPKSLKYIPKELVDNLKTGRIVSMLYEKPSLVKIFANKLNSYELRYLAQDKPVIIKYLPVSVLNNFDRWDLYQIVKDNDKAFEYLEPYLDEYRPEDKYRIKNQY